MLILRCLRPDRMIHAISSFVSKHLGAVFVNPPPFDLKLALADSQTTTPLIFILSQGTDPTAMLSNFVKECKYSADHLTVVALGQG